MGEMRDVDTTTKVITSTSGTCIPSHDREQLTCYFASFGLWRVRTDEQVKKDDEELRQAFQKDPVKQLKDMKESFCSKKAEWLQPDAGQKVNPRAAGMIASIRAFCENPTLEEAIKVSRALNAMGAKKCRCVVTDWRSTLLRQTDRWVENRGPSGLCGVVDVFTLVPHDLAKVKGATGPVL